MRLSTVKGLFKGVFVCAGLCVSAIALANTGAVNSGCKGASESQCQSSTQCRWINGFERADGVVVRSYCRKGAKRKQTSGLKKAADAVPVAKSTRPASTKRPSTRTTPVTQKVNEPRARKAPDSLSGKLKAFMFDD